jgi:hypothetical protein
MMMMIVKTQVIMNTSTPKKKINTNFIWAKHSSHYSNHQKF